MKDIEGLYPWLVLAGCIMLIHVVAKFFSKSAQQVGDQRFFPNDQITPSMPRKASKKTRSECNFSKDSYQVMPHLVVSWPRWKFFFRWYVVRYSPNFNFTHQLRCVTGLRLAFRETIEVGLLVHLPMHVVHLSKGIK